MTLPVKVQTAIALFAQYDIAADAVAPFWYRQFLRYRPDTPPPLFGASRDYWSFRALKIGLGLGAFITLVLLAIASQVAVPAEKLLAFTPPAQFVIWSVAGVTAWLITLGMMDKQRQERTRMALPDWREFSADWRPAVELIRDRADLQRFWLRGIRNTPMFAYGGFAGSAAFLVFALTLPLQAGRLGILIALANAILCVVALHRSNQSRAMKSKAGLWQFSNGFWLGMLFAAVLWTYGYATIVDYPRDDAIWVFFASILLLHALDARAYDGQRNHAMRIEHTEQAKRLAEIRLHALRSQIEPHFIFNTIAHLKSMIATEPRMAEQMADDLSDFLRASLEALKHDWSTVEVEMSLAKAYLDIAKRRMGSRLSSHIRFDAAAKAVKIPPLLLQTLLENAVQHGVEPKAIPSNIHVTLDVVAGNNKANTQSNDQSINKSRILLRVVDDGVGFGMANASVGGAGGVGGSGIGLANIRERLQAAYGMHATFTLTANTPSGVIAELNLPMEGLS